MPRTSRRFERVRTGSKRLRRAFARILAFYGFESRRLGRSHAASAGRLTGPADRANWLRPANHNHLRLTRIMKSLTLLGLSEEARALSLVLLELAGDPKNRTFSRTTVRIWNEAWLEAGGSGLGTGGNRG